jgi:hypothetical protein
MNKLSGIIVIGLEVNVGVVSKVTAAEDAVAVAFGEIWEKVGVGLPTKY